MFVRSQAFVCRHRFVRLTRLSGHHERNYLAEAVVIEPVESADLASGNVASPLAHHSNSSLRIRSLKGVYVVDERRLGSDLEVSNHAVALEEEEKVELVTLVKITIKIVPFRIDI